MNNRIFLIVVSLLTGQLAFNQVPNGFNYQAIVRDSQGEPVPNQPVNFRISLLVDSPDGESVYAETQHTTTNNYGLVNLIIGEGDSLLGDFSAINWGATMFIQIELDRSGGSNFILMGTSQLMSVPYALQARTAQIDNVEDADADATNELQAISISNDTIYLSNGGFVKLPDQVQVLSKSGNTLTLSNGGGSVTLKEYTAGSGISISGQNVISIPAINLEVGDEAFEGYVIFTNDDGNHGLVIKFLNNNTAWLGAVGAISISSFNNSEYYDWRLPTIHELQHAEAILESKGITGITGNFWTGITSGTDAYVVSMDNGNFSIVGQNENYKVALVRTF